MPGEKFGSKKPYLSVVEGVLRQKVTEDTPGAERRDYELKDGTKGTKFEISFKSWSGRIQDLRIKDSEYGENLEVEFEDSILTLNTESRYFTDFVKKLANINVNQSITISPYDFESDGKQIKGITIYQNYVKTESYYWDKIKGESCNGFPKPDGGGAGFKKDDWKIYYLTVKKFLIKELDGIKAELVEDTSDEATQPEPPEENPTIEIAEEIPVEESKDEVKLADVPF